MLFNSSEFIFFFLPITWLGFFGIGRYSHHRVAIAWLVGASLFFYSWWNPAYLGLILFSILFNYAAGTVLSQHMAQGPSGLGGASSATGKALLGFGVGVNLALLGYFKYANFFVDNLNAVARTDFVLGPILLPLAISFFTFQQIAYLVDTYRGETREYNFLHYCLFVTFFPQLIAGPIVHHREMLPQFARDTVYRINPRCLLIGCTVFGIGLFKKMMADSVAVFATPMFDAAETGLGVTFFDAWAGSLAYTLQLYFDFSGYSDMAIGLGNMFNIRLPLNFHSPYKANNIIDFWRRWHMTLSRFLRDYLYIPLGGNKKGRARRYVNLMATMLLGGLWHGAAWTFVVWGGLHGVYLVVNHGWRSVRRRLGGDPRRHTVWGLGLSRVVTFLAVVVGWVFFRAHSFQGAVAIVGAMAGQNGVILPEWYQSPLNFLAGLGEILAALGCRFEGGGHVVDSGQSTGMLIVLLAIAWFAPNTQQWMAREKPALGLPEHTAPALRLAWLYWRPSLSHGCLFGLMLFVLIKLACTALTSEFLYFNF